MTTTLGLPILRKPKLPMTLASQSFASIDNARLWLALFGRQFLAHTVWGALLVVIALDGGSASAQVTGDKIYVVNDTDLKSGANSIGKVTAGNILTVEDAQPGWYLVYHRSFGTRGWIPGRDTMTLPAALQQFESTIQNNPTVFAYRGRALIWKSRGEMEPARRDLEAALRLDPRDAYTWHTKGTLAMQLGDWPTAVADFDEAVRFTSDPVVRSSALHNRGLSWLRQKQLDNAIADFDQCLQLNQNNADALAHRGEARTRRGDFDLAFADLSEALRLNPKNQHAWFERGYNHELREDWEQAVADYSQAVRVDPKFAAALCNRGSVRQKQGMTAPAIEDFSAALQLEPKLTVALRDRARAFETQGDFAKASADLDAVVALDPGVAIRDGLVEDTENEIRVGALIRRAEFYARRDLAAKAKADLDHALQIVDREQADSLSQVARFLATCPTDALRQGTQAVELAKLAAELTKFENHQILDILAAAYAESGDFEKAAATENQALALASTTKQKGHYQARLEMYTQNKRFHEEN